MRLPDPVSLGDLHDLALSRAVLRIVQAESSLFEQSSPYRYSQHCAENPNLGFTEHRELQYNRTPGKNRAYVDRLYNSLEQTVRHR